MIHTPEMEKKRINALRSKLKGKPRTEETKRKISERLKGKKRLDIEGSKHPNWKGGLPKCKICGKNLSTRKAEFCPKHKGNNSPGTGFKKGQSAWNEGKKMPQYSQEKHWNWQGGISSLNNKLRNTIEYKAWRLDIYQRDWFTCQMPGCGYKGKDIEAHHIKGVKKFPELILSTMNGITLCEPCHKRILHNEEKYEKLFLEIISNKIKELSK